MISILLYVWVYVYEWAWRSIIVYVRARFGSWKLTRWVILVDTFYQCCNLNRLSRVHFVLNISSPSPTIKQWNNVTEGHNVHTLYHCSSLNKRWFVLVLRFSLLNPHHFHFHVCRSIVYSLMRIVIFLDNFYTTRTTCIIFSLILNVYKYLFFLRGFNLIIILLTELLLAGIRVTLV